MTEVIQPGPITAEGDDVPVIAADAYENYWGVDETHQFFLPDGKQFFEIKPMNEGAKVQFQKLTNKGVRMNQRSQEATFDIDPAEERWTLIKQSVVGWMIMQPVLGSDGKPTEWVPYPCPPDETRRKRALEQLLDQFNPKAVQDLEFFIRQKNPWMQADMDVDEIDKEIERLQQMRRDVVNQQQGEGSSANK